MVVFSGYAVNRLEERLKAPEATAAMRIAMGHRGWSVAVRGTATIVAPSRPYWRARPLPFGNLRWTAYGSSFLIGPVEIQERPLVAFKDVMFDPKTLSFDLAFTRGGSARIAFAAIDQSEIKLDVTYSAAMPEKRAFASLRSMYASERVADVARVAWRAPGASAWDEAPVMSFSGAPAVTELWAGRRAQSRHNLSAPDMIFSHFASAASSRPT